MEKLALKEILARMIAHKAEGPSPVDRRAAAADASILIVDDSRTVVRALQLILERVGYLTFFASDGAQAIALAKRQRPDLILMDVVMPVMNGFEATRVLVNDPQTAAIPVIMMSGAERVSDQIWGTRLGAKAFLAKPFNTQELLGKIRSVIAVSRRAREYEQTAASAGTDAFRR